MKKLLFIIFGSLLVLSLASCSLDLFGLNKTTSIALTSNKSTIDIDAAITEYITITAQCKSKNGDAATPKITWDFDKSVFRQVGSASNTLRLELNLDGVGVAGKDITGRTVIKGSADGVFSDIIINVTGQLKSIWFEDSSGNMISSINMNQKDMKAFAIGTYPRSAQAFELIGQNDDSNPDVAQITVNSSARTATVSTNLPGSAKLYVRTTDSVHQAALTVNVSEKEIPMTAPAKIIIANGAFISTTTLSGQTQLNAVVYDQFNREITDNVNIEWESSERQVASISPSNFTALLTPLKNGSTVVTASIKELNISAQTTVIVGSRVSDLIISSYSPATSSTFTSKSLTVTDTEKPQSTSTFPIGKTAYFKVDYIPADTDEKGVIWTTDSDAIELKANGDIVEIKAAKTGTANLIATSKTDSSVASYIRLHVFDPAATPDLSISYIKLTPSVDTIEEGSFSTFSATAVFQDGTEGKTDISWTTDSSYISIDSTSADTSSVKIKGEVPGTATLTAVALSNPNVSSSAAIMVYKAGTDPGAALKRITATPSAITLIEGSEAKISVNYLPETASRGIYKPTCSSDFISIGAYDESTIMIEAKKKGSGTVSVVSSTDPSISAEINVNVLTAEQAQLPARIKLSKNALELKKGTNETIEAFVYSLTGQITDAKVGMDILTGQNVVKASATENRIKIEALSAGEATISIYSENKPEIKSQIEVYVYETAGSSKKLLKLIPEFDSITIEENDELTVGISFIPADTTEKDLIWTTSGNGVVYLEETEDGVKVLPAATGTAKITAQSTTSPSIKTSFTVKVVTSAENYPASFISFDAPVLRVQKNFWTPLVATIFNTQGKTMTGLMCDWSIQDGSEYIETSPTNYGELRIKGIKEGIAHVKATSKDYPNVSATAEILVYGDGAEPDVYLEKLIPSTGKITLIENTSYNIGLNYYPANTFQKEVQWTSDRDSVASVEAVENGAEIKAVAASATPARITVQSKQNPEIKAEVAVSVISAAEASKLISRIEMPTLFEVNPPYPTTEQELLPMSVDASGNMINDSYVVGVSQTQEVLSIREGAQGRIYYKVLRPGQAVLSVTSKTNPNISATLTVEAKGGLEKITVSPASLRLYKNGKATITAGVIPLNASNVDLAWEAYSNDGINRINMTTSYTNSNSTTVTGQVAGKTKIKVYQKNDPSIMAVCDIEVLDETLPEGSMPNEIRLSSSVITIDPPYETAVLTATVYGTDGTVYPIGVDWSIQNGGNAQSSDLIATLTPSGKYAVMITPKLAGNATITATSTVDASVTATAALDIRGAIAKIAFTNLENNQELVEIINGNSFFVRVAATAASGGQTVENDLEWYVDGFVPVYDEAGKIKGYDTNDDGQVDENDDSSQIVTLRPTSNGCTISARSVGETTLYVRSKTRHEVFATLAVNVIPVPAVTGKIELKPSQISLSPSSKTTLVTATISTDSNYSFPSDVKIDLSLDNRDLLEFSSPLWNNDGTVYTIYAGPGSVPGSGYLTASLPDYPGIKSASIRVFLGGTLTGFEPFNPNGDDDVLIISKGDIVNIGVDYIPENTQETGIIWSSDDRNIIDGDFTSSSNRITITAKNAGTARLTATSVAKPSVKYTFTITVKPIIEAVSFTSVNSTSHQSGLTFLCPPEEELTLKCDITPSLLNDTKKLTLSPHGILPGGKDNIATLKTINGTMNDYIFVPDPSFMGTYQYDIIDQKESVAGTVLGLLTINVAADGLSFKVEQGASTYSPSSIILDKYTDSFIAYVATKDGIPLANVDWKIDNPNICKITDNGDNTVTITPRYARNPSTPSSTRFSAGTTKLTASAPNGPLPFVAELDLTVNYDIPDGLETALINSNTITEHNGGRVKSQLTGKMVSVLTPEVFDNISTVNLSNITDIPGGIEVNGYLFLFRNMQSLLLNDSILSDDNLVLTNCQKLKVLEANNWNSGFKITDITSPPSSLEEVYLANNNISTVRKFQTASMRIIDLQNNLLTGTFDDSGFSNSLYSVDLSGNPQLTRATLRKPYLKIFKASNCALTTIDAPLGLPALTDLIADNNQITSCKLSTCNNLTLLEIQNNKLGNGTLEIGGYKYEKGTVNTGDYRQDNNPGLKIVASNNGITYKMDAPKGNHFFTVRWGYKTAGLVIVDHHCWHSNSLFVSDSIFVFNKGADCKTYIDGTEITSGVKHKGTLPVQYYRAQGSNDGLTQIIRAYTQSLSDHGGHRDIFPFGEVNPPHQ